MINKGGTTWVVMSTDEFRSTVTPGTTHAVGGVFADQSGTSTDPKLVVVYDTAVQLVVADATVATSGENAVLTQANVLTVDDAAVATTADNVSLTSSHTQLAVQNASIAVTADNVVLQQPSVPGTVTFADRTPTVTFVDRTPTIRITEV